MNRRNGYFWSLAVALFLALSVSGLAVAQSLSPESPLTNEEDLTGGESHAAENGLQGVDSAVEAAAADQLPDLVVTEITLDPPNPTAGGSVTVTIVVKNEGAAAAGFFMLYYYIDPKDDPPTVDTPIEGSQGWPGLQPGASQPIQFVGRPVTKNNPKVYAWVNRDKVIQESDFENNLYPPPDSGPVGEPDEFEPDNTCAEATTIPTDGIPQARNLYRENNQPDVDWVKFSAVGGVVYVIHAEKIGSDADVNLELHAECDMPPSFGVSVNIRFTAPADGDYYIKVAHRDAVYGPDNDYRLSVTGRTTCVDEYEPNDWCSLAGLIAVGAGPQGHAFCNEGDVDWLRFEVKAGARYNINTRNIGARADAQVSLYPSCDMAVASSGIEFGFTSSTAGELFLKVQNRDPAVYGPDSDYTVEVTLDGPDGCIPDSFEFDDGPGEATPLNINGPLRTYNICPAGDVDWTKFTATAGVTYTVETLNLGPKADTILCVYDKDETQIACDDDGGAGLGSRVVFQAPAAEDYLVKVRHVDPDVAGAETAYDIQVITGLCRNDTFEPNSSREEAKPIQVDGDPQQHNICPAGDEDWVVFQVEAGTDYVVETSDVGPDADTVIEVYEAAGTRVAFNDDFGPGIASRVGFRAAESGDLYVRTRLYNATVYGAGTEYKLGVRKGTVDPPLPPSETPSTEVQIESAPPTGVRTLILVNLARITQLYSAPEASLLLLKLQQLAAHADVRGEIIRLDNNTNVAEAYAAWLDDLTSVDKANLTADAIRRVIMNYVQEREGVEYVILVGDDRALPMRRVRDYSKAANVKISERDYKFVDPSHPTGAALAADYILNDDFYVDPQPTSYRNRSIYLPDMAVGRLIETPADMRGLIDGFLAEPEVVVERALVTGYDFVQDTAQLDCADWGQALGNAANVSCLIGDSWTKPELQNLQLRTDQPYRFQSINGHADHFAQGIPASLKLDVNEINNANVNWRGGLVYTLACHGGLNIPPGGGRDVPLDDPSSGLDLPEIFARKGANYIGNTGYGWGNRFGIGWSERLMRLFVTEMLGGSSGSVGKALAKAKNEYYRQMRDFSPLDEKVVQQVVYYGLPMLRLKLPGSFSIPPNKFPDVGFDFVPPADALNGTDDSDVITGSLTLNFAQALNNPDAVREVETEDGNYLSLYDSVILQPGAPVQPLHFGNVTDPKREARSALMLSGSFEVRDDFDPLYAAPVNEFVEEVAEPLSATLGWYPPSPTTVQTHRGQANLVTQLGQYNPGTEELRVFSSLNVEVYFSNSEDQVPPEIRMVDGIFAPATNQVSIKTEVVDPVGVKEVYATYVTDGREPSAEFRSIPLTLDNDSQKWIGSFTGNEHSRFYIQAVDKAGNLGKEENKGRYFAPALAWSSDATAGSCNGQCLYVPTVNRP